MTVIWRDPDFNASEYSFYYVRILEIPTPHWTAYDARDFKVRDVQMTFPLLRKNVFTPPRFVTHHNLATHLAQVTTLQ